MVPKTRESQDGKGQVWVSCENYNFSGQKVDLDYIIVTTSILTPIWFYPQRNLEQYNMFILKAFDGDIVHICLPNMGQVFKNNDFSSAFIK